MWHLTLQQHFNKGGISERSGFNSTSDNWPKATGWPEAGHRRAIVGKELVANWSRAGHRLAPGWYQAGPRLATGWPQARHRLATG